MRIQTIILSGILMLELFGSKSSAQESDDKPSSGKPVILVFTNFSSYFNKEAVITGFEITRAYLGYEHDFSENFSSKVIFDVGDPEAGGLQMTAFVKNASLNYESKGFSARLGMIGTDQYSVQEQHWGYRYIYKSFGDEYSLGSSADLGAGIKYSPARFISLDASLLNGEGYKKLQSDSILKASLGVTLKPSSGLIVRAYYDFMGSESAQSTLALFAGYTLGPLRLGFEYNFQKSNMMREGNDLSGFSTWAAVSFAEKFSLFARYDQVGSVSADAGGMEWNYDNDGELLLAGVDYSPVRGVKIAPVWMGWFPADRSKSFFSRAGLHFEIRY